MTEREIYEAEHISYIQALRQYVVVFIKQNAFMKSTI